LKGWNELEISLDISKASSATRERLQSAASLLGEPGEAGDAGEVAEPGEAGERWSDITDDTVFDKVFATL
jgi:hypothetical protein